MGKKWSPEIQDTVVRLICEEKQSTGKTAKTFGVPVKTVEKWVTKYNKNRYVFDDTSKEDLIMRIKKLERENDILKKTISIVSKID